MRGATESAGMRANQWRLVCDDVRPPAVRLVNTIRTAPITLTIVYPFDSALEQRRRSKFSELGPYPDPTNDRDVDYQGRIFYVYIAPA